VVFVQNTRYKIRYTNRVIIQNVKYRYCPSCKGDLAKKEDALRCSFCDAVIYPSAAPAVGVLPVKDGKVLLAKRAVEPQKDRYDTIGGFVSYGENPIDTAHRETKEESGLKIDMLEILGIYPDQYGPDSKTIVIQYVVKIVGGKPKPQDDVAALEWFDINNPPTNLAFENTKQTLADLQKWNLKAKSKNLRKTLAV
jgi:8-oxo-dGTP diphosphatase